MSALWVHVEGLAGIRGEGLVSLSPEETRHVVSRRLRVGDALVAFDGEGHTASGRIEVASKRAVEIALGPVTGQDPARTGFGLASAIPKGERLSTMLPMLIQLGLETWQPLVLDESSVRKLDADSPRLRRIRIEGCKVARRPWAMRVRPPLGLEQALEAVRGEAEPDRARSVPLFYGDRLGQGKGLDPGPAWVFIGPEAGFTARERSLLEAAGAEPRCFGPHNLRIETAAIAATVAHFVAQGAGNPT